MPDKNAAQNGFEKIVITGTGMMCSVGHDSIMAPASMWAGISRFEEIPDFKPPGGATCAGGLIEGITDDMSGNDRLLSMAIPAAQEALFSAEEFYQDLDLAAGKLFLSLPPAERPLYGEFGQDEISTLLEASQAEQIGSVELIREGHAGGILALGKSFSQLQNDEAEVCIVGGVDSLTEYSTLAWLDEALRLKTDLRGSGFMPGEAAAFLVLERETTARKRGAPILAELASLAYTMEEAHLLSDKPLFGKGLSESIKTLLAYKQIEPHQISGIICDLNGEHYRMKEWGLALAKIFDGSYPVPDLWHPAESIGDIGAASAIFLAVLGVSAINNNYFSGPEILVWTSSDKGGRGSALLTSFDENKLNLK